MNVMNNMVPIWYQGANSGMGEKPYITKALFALVDFS